MAESGLFLLVTDDRLLTVFWVFGRYCGGSCGTAGSPDELAK